MKLSVFTRACQILLLFSSLAIFTGCGGGDNNNTNPFSVSGATPTNLATTAGAESITLNWDAVAGTTSYNVYWSTSPDPINSGAKVSVADNTFLHDPLPVWQPYYYVVTAITDLGEGPPTAEVSDTPWRLLADITFDANLAACIAFEFPGALYDGEIQPTLDCNTSGITNLTGIDWLTSLTGLDLSNNTITDISLLGGLTGLTSLNLNTNPGLANLAPLAGLTNLTNLVLHSANISVISALTGLSNLTSLNILNNSIVTIPDMSGLTSLTSLYLGDNSIVDVTNLGSLSSLTDLHLYGNSIAVVSSLAPLSNIVYLDLSTNLLADVSGITSLAGYTDPDIVLSTNNIISCADQDALETIYASHSGTITKSATCIVY